MSRKAIAAVNARLMRVFAERDAVTVAGFYTADGKLMTPHAEAHVGREAILGAVEEDFGSGIAHLTLETADLEVLGDTAWEDGLFTTADRAGERLDHGKYIVIWKRVGGGWLLARDIMSSNLPAR